jgi:hypothetical protein
MTQNAEYQDSEHEYGRLPLPPNADYVRVIEKCSTEYDHDDGIVRFTVRCYLDAGHGGSHRGVARIDFAPLLLPHNDSSGTP